MQGRDPVLTVAEVQAAEQALFDAGLPPFELMQRAGNAAAQWVWRVAAGRSVTVLCGPGNNGGDGYVIATWLHRKGCDVAVVAPMEPATDSAKQARSGYDGAVIPQDETRAAGVFVDCLFGSGQNRALSEELWALVQDLRGTHSTHIAVDLPSGVASDDARLFHDLPPYDITLALGAWKRAHWAMPSAPIMGRRMLVDIGLDIGEGTACLIGKPGLQRPSAQAHKYTRGLVAVVAGAMPGAAALCARAAQHGGAGYVKLLCDDAPHGLPDSIVADNRPLEEALGDSRIATIVIGPGLGRDEEAKGRLAHVLGLKRDVPTVLDADALHWIGPEFGPKLPDPLVLTPHEGELVALLEAYGCAQQLSEGAPEKVLKAQAIAQSTQAIVVAKGADTFIAQDGWGVAIAPPAPSWLSVAGTGDVLAGLIASRLATGAAPGEAAREAVWLHGEAARLSGPVFSADGLVAALQDAYAACL